MKKMETKQETEKQHAYSYEYPRPALAVDCVVFGADLEAERLEVLLIERDLEPFEGSWALPGGFVRMDESLDDAAARELAEEAGVKDLFLEQLYTFGAPGRDPRGRVVSVAYYALVSPREHEAIADTDARDARWFPADELPELAFDHASIVESAYERLRGKVRYKPIGFELLPEKFTLSQLQTLYEVILGEKLDKRNFQRKLHRMGVLEDTGELQQGVPHRAARYYSFDRAAYARLERDGFEFAL